VSSSNATTLDVPEPYLASAAPIIVTSPTTRCGTTLVQRLLSASDNAFLFGEEIGKHVVTMTQSFVAVMSHIEQNGAALDGYLERALTGNVDDWQPGLMAPSDVMLRGWVETYYQLPLVLSDFAGSVGRSIWGFKFPALPVDTLRALLILMPRAKVVYVFRNPFDALKSAKARKFVKSETDAAEFAARWARNMNDCSVLAADPRVLFVRYEDLVQEPISQTRLLEAFTQVAGARARVFDTKVNTFLGDEALGHSPTQYIEPQDLTDAERRLVRSRVGPTIGQFYPRI
jgi:Sulfotransferase family